MGQDIAEYGGAFKITEGLVEEFGKKRVRNTPLCESAIVGVALGLSLEGYKSVMEMQFADFVTVGFNQIVNNLAKIHYRWGSSLVSLGLVVRSGSGQLPRRQLRTFQCGRDLKRHTHILGCVRAPVDGTTGVPSSCTGYLLASVPRPSPSGAGCSRWSWKVQVRDSGVGRTASIL